MTLTDETLQDPDRLLADLDTDLDTDSAPTGAALTCAAALLAALSFGWLAGSAFAGPLARLVGVAGAVVGVAAAYASTRSSRPSLVQYAGAALAVVLGALLVLPDATAGTSALGLVEEAVRGGGLGDPPVAFDPGWRPLLLIATALLGEAAAALALALRSPRAATGVAVPFVVGAALLQPPGGELTGTLVALLLLLASLVVSLGADLAAEGASSGGFELRRLARGAGALAVIGALLAGASQVGFLFPSTTSEDVVPPMRPPRTPPGPDRVLFTVTADAPMTWRLGTLDVYRDGAWMTPPFDPARQVDLAGDVPTTAPGETRGPLPTGRTTTVRYSLQGLTGKSLPGTADPRAVRGLSGVQYDPRTQGLRTTGTRLRAGTAYDVVTSLPPTGATLSAAGPAAPQVQEYLEVPPPPPEVVRLLTQAPEQPFARLQFVREALFANVVAAGAGDPIDLSPERAAEVLAGDDATPYEITATEALLARWAGVPSRLGYGWFGGDRTSGGFEIRPKHGATWLEAHFTGVGWVPIVGTPPQARTSLSNTDKNADPSVQASKELALVVYVPVRLSTVQLLYLEARYYAVRVLPVALLLALAVALVAPAAKLVRRLRRRRTALRAGPVVRVAAAYAELRDVVTDLSIAGPAVSPLELLERVEPDDEHTELAWLVTRAVWGDLRDALAADDVTAAEELSRSVTRRLRRAQQAFSRISAALSRASLREPWTRELPNGWARAPRWVLPTAAGTVVAVLASVVAVAVTRDEPPPAAPVALPNAVAPASVGDVELVREADAEQAFVRARATSLAGDGRVLSLRQGDVVQGSLQVVGLVAEADTRDRRTRQEVLQGLGRGRFEPGRLGEERVFRIVLPEQRLLLAFDPDGRGYSLMVTRAAFTQADAVFAAVLAFRRGERPGTIVDVPVPDPRRGSPS